MVKDTRAAARASVIRALNRPIPLGVEVDSSGLPKTLKLHNRWVTVELIEDRWRIDDEWWREQPVSRTYHQCIVDHGLVVTVFHDLVTGLWYLQRI